MKKLILLLTVAAIVLAGCKKNEAPQADQATGEVQFSIHNIMDEGSRVEIPGIPDCDLQATPLYAIVGITSDVAGTLPITGSPFTMNINEFDSDLMTDVLKLVPGTYYVTQFDVYGADGDDTDTDDDLIWAAPTATSFYNSFMNIKLNLEFTVVAYQKSGYEVEVLCYEETVADQFGFTWFDIDKVVLRDICLFGDICANLFPGVTTWNDNGYSFAYDMPAQFQVELYRDGATTPLSVYQNYDDALDTYTDDTPLCIQYPDALEIPDEAFELVLKVWQPDGDGVFELYKWYTFEWMDDATDLFDGDDNVIDFYVGDCFNDATPPDYFWTEIGEPDPDPVAPGAGDLVITEIIANPDVIPDGDGEWFEVYNVTDHPIEMEGLVIRDDDFDSFTIVGTLVVPSNGYVVLGLNGNEEDNGGVTLDYVYSGFALGNSGDEVVIETVNPTILIDHAAYTYSSGGRSWTLDPNFLDANANDNPANWCLSTSYYNADNQGTPGADNDNCN
ncbi:MAG: lamin tail domain-containing protein [Bacteroidetes bacterium]|nr:lamin tail domain-containing protein [Bacteroidota bacterium]